MSELRNTWVNSLPEQVLENTQDIAELQQGATDEAINRENADNALQNQITAEVSAREAADQNLQQQINDIETGGDLPEKLEILNKKLLQNDNNILALSADLSTAGQPAANGLLRFTPQAFTIKVGINNASNALGFQMIQGAEAGTDSTIKVILYNNNTTSILKEVDLFNLTTTQTVTTTFAELYSKLQTLRTQGKNIKRISFSLSTSLEDTVYRTIIRGSEITQDTNTEPIINASQTMIFYPTCISASSFSFMAKISSFNYALSIAYGILNIAYDYCSASSSNLTIRARIGNYASQLATESVVIEYE